MSKRQKVLLAAVSAVVIVGVIAAIVVGKQGTLKTETNAGCNALNKMLNDASLSDKQISGEAPVREQGMEKHFRKKCPNSMSRLDEIDANLVSANSSDDAEATADDATSSPEGRTYSASDFEPSQVAGFVVYLRDADPYYENMSNDELLHLGAQVCTFISRGDEEEDIIDVLTYSSGIDGMTVARLVVAASTELC